MNTPTDHNQWIVYLLRCADNSLYCGITNDLKDRLAAHKQGKGAKYARSRTPLELVVSLNDSQPTNLDSASRKPVEYEDRFAEYAYECDETLNLS